MTVTVCSNFLQLFSFRFMKLNNSMVLDPFRSRICAIESSLSARSVSQSDIPTAISVVSTLVMLNLDGEGWVEIQLCCRWIVDICYRFPDMSKLPKLT